MTKFKPEKCRTRFCRGRTSESGKSPYCSRCRSRNWDANHPMEYAFHNLRVRAGQRGHEFKLTLAEYAKFWHESGYAEKRGKTAKSLSIHRIENHRGYSADNICSIPLSWNSRLQFAPMPEYVRAQMMEAIKSSQPQQVLSER